MATENKKMRPIWYFVGLMLLSMGSLVLLSGIYYLIYPTHLKTVLSEYYPNIWWGALMVLAGALFLIRTRKATVD